MTDLSGLQIVRPHSPVTQPSPQFSLQTALEPAEAPLLCGPTYESGNRAIKNLFQEMHIVVAGEDAPTEEIQAIGANLVSSDELSNWLDSDLWQLLLTRRDEAIQGIQSSPIDSTADAGQDSSSTEDILDQQGATVERPDWMEKYKITRQIWSWLSPGVQECLSVRPDAEGRGPETRLQTYDDCHDGAVTALSLAITGAQLVFTAMGAIPVAGVLELVNTGLDAFDLGLIYLSRQAPKRTINGSERRFNLPTAPSQTGKLTFHACCAQCNTM